MFLFNVTVWLVLRSPRKAVVTGGCGFIGSHIIDKLLDLGIETYALDDLTNGTLENVTNHLDNKLFHFVYGDKLYYIASSFYPLCPIRQYNNNKISPTTFYFDEDFYWKVIK